MANNCGTHGTSTGNDQLCIKCYPGKTIVSGHRSRIAPLIKGAYEDGLNIDDLKDLLNNPCICNRGKDIDGDCKWCGRPNK